MGEVALLATVMLIMAVGVGFEERFKLREKWGYTLGLVAAHSVLGCYVLTARGADAWPLIAWCWFAAGVNLQRLVRRPAATED